MQRYADAILDRNGRAVQGATVLVKTIAGATAAIYKNNGGTVEQNPLPTDELGRFAFYAADGRYSLDVYVGGTLYATVPDILLEDPADESSANINGGAIKNVTLENITIDGAAPITPSALATVDAKADLAIDTANTANANLASAQADAQAAQADAQAALDAANAAQETADAAVQSTDLAASTGASLVGFSQNQSYAPGTIGAKAQQTIDVSDAPFNAPTGGADATEAIQSAINFAIANNKKLTIHKDYIVSNLSYTGYLEIEGRGSITKKAGTTGHLISANGVLVIDGDIKIDQNAENCPNAAATSSSDCAIYHTGTILDMRGVTLPASVSANIKSSATALFYLTNCYVDGGWMNVLATVGTACKVRVIGGRYSNGKKDDNVQIQNSLDFVVDGIESYGSARSGLTISSAGANGRIVNNYCHDNKIDGSNQGGWGIVCSVSVNSVVIAHNICKNNQRGPCTVDTYTTGTPSYTTARVIVIGNLFDGGYNGGYCTTGLGINGAQYASVLGNRFRRASQHILGADNAMTLVSGNSFEDCGTGYFAQFTTSNYVKISGNMMHTSGAASSGVIGAFTCGYFEATDNQITGLTGGGRHAFRITDTSDFLIANNNVEKDDAGSGYCIWLTGTLNRGRIRGNRFYSAAAAWQYYINASSTTLSDVVTERNEIVCSGIQTNPNRYILGQPAIVSDGDTINGVRDYYSAAPAFCAFRQGQTAGIAGALKMWNGSAWI